MNPNMSLLRRLKQRSVWNPLNIEDIPERYRGLYTVVTPIKLALFSIFGLVGTEARIPAIDDTFGSSYGDIWTIALVVTSVIAFLAAAFYPIAKKIEMYSIIFMSVLMTFYALAVAWQAIVNQDIDRGAFSVAILIFLVYPVWNTIDLLWEVRPKEVMSNE